MKLFKYMKDGGPESKVAGYWLIECKSLFSVVLLHFSNGSREAYHSHAFNSMSWVLKGTLVEHQFTDLVKKSYVPSAKPIITTRSNMHKVTSLGDTWVLSFRGPWSSTWREFLPKERKFITLTHGRKVVS